MGRTRRRDIGCRGLERGCPRFLAGRAINTITCCKALTRALLKKQLSLT